MPILTTNKGLAAITNAEVGGFLVDLSDFAVTEATDVDLSIADTKLVGDVVYANRIQSIEVVSASTVKLTLYIPPRAPDAGKWTLTEIGLYLKSGEMFAHGTFKTPREKTNEYGLKIFVYVTAARLGNVINISLSTNASLASTANVRSLLDPRESDVNAVVVQDGLDTIENVLVPTSATLAVKYGAGGMQWAFLGHDLVYHGRAKGVASTSKFVMDVGVDGGFWLNHNEIVNIQVISGPGAGESRRVKYNRDAITFDVLELPFSELTNDSIINVWRPTVNQLPTRNAAIDKNYVLGVGKNTWTKKEIPSDQASTDLIPRRVSLMTDGSKGTFALTGVPKASLLDGEMFAVWLGGKLLSSEEYSVSVESGLVLNMDIPDANIPIEVLYYAYKPSSGSALTFIAADDVADGSIWQFNLPMIPKDAHYIMVFVDGQMIPASKYIYAGTSITFTETAPVGNVKILCCGNFEELGASTKMHRVEYSIAIQSDGKAQPIQLSADYLDKRNTFVFVDGNLIDINDFDINVNMLSFYKTFAHGLSVRVIAFEGKIQPVESVQISGENTGPMWVDPAGSYIPTNRIVAVRVGYFGNGQAASYRMNSRADKALVFIDGLFQNPSTIRIDSETGSITLPEPLAIGKEIDIISFESLPDEVGEEIKCWRQNFDSIIGQKVYSIQAPQQGMAPSLTIVSVGGVYAHASKYTLDTDRITFKNALPPGLKVELWHYCSIPAEGFSNMLTLNQFNLDRDRSKYIHAFYDEIPIEGAGTEENTLLFASTVQQLGSDFDVANEDAYVLTIPNVGTAHSVLATSIAFHSGRSKTRLVVRDELIQRYMTREEILARKTVTSAAISGAQLQFTLSDGSVQKIDIPIPDGANYVNKAGDTGVGRLLFKSGTAALPSIAFEADFVQDTGFYHMGDGSIGVALNGVHAIEFRGGGHIITNGEISGLSDESLKENVEPIKDALAIVRGILGVTYNRNDKGPNAPREAGFIAQNVYKYFPEVVRTSGDGKLTLVYTQMVAVAFEAIKTVDDKVEAVDDRVDALEKLVKELQEEIQRIKGV